MFRHVVLFTWKPGTTPQQAEQVAATLRTLPGVIEQIRAYHVGRDAGLNPGNYEFAVVADFDTVADYLVYRDHPERDRGAPSGGAPRSLLAGQGLAAGVPLRASRSRGSGGRPRASRAPQKASSGSSIRSRVVFSAMSRSTASLGSTVCAKNRAVASLPW